MNVLIIANQTSSELAALTRESCLSMLPIAGKPLIEHTLESVARFSPETTTIIASRGLDSIRDFIGSGERWGLLIDVVSSRPNEPISKLQKNNEKLFTGDLLIVECNRLRGFAFNDFLQAVEEIKSSAIAFSAMTQEQPAGVHLVKNSLQEGTVDLSSVDIEQISMPEAYSWDLKTPVDLHNINMLAATGKIPTITTRGKERALGMTTGFMTQIHPRSLEAGCVHAGNHCRVHPTCTLTGNVVLNHGVVVDRHSKLENTLVLNQTYVGENLDIKNAILSGDLLIRVDTGAVVEVTDRFLTAKLGENLYDTHFANVTNQLIGIVLFLVSLPLWPIALLWSFANSPHRPVKQYSYLGNKVGRGISGRKVFSTVEFAAQPKLLKKLPLVLAIATGHIRLVGVSLCTPNELSDRTDSWETVRNSAPVGALGPTQLYLSDDVSIDEKILTDTIFAQQSSVMSSVQTCWQAIRAVLGFPVDQNNQAMG